jgi:hypothetical protein
MAEMTRAMIASLMAVDIAMIPLVPYERRCSACQMKALAEIRARDLGTGLQFFPVIMLI